MNFNSRETYLAAVAQWKAEYLQLSKDIRKTKLEIKKAYRENGPLWKYLEAYGDQRRQANDLLRERAEGKEEAQRQYMEAHAVTEK